MSHQDVARPTPPRRQALTIAVLVALTATAACGGGTQPRSTPPVTTARGSTLPVGGQPVVLDPARFTTTIDNPYDPMTPGVRRTYTETSIDEHGAVEVLTAVVVVTGQTKKLADGVTARVVRDTLWNGSQIVEDTIDWYAQDDAGNVWYLGEDTAEFRDGQVSTRAGSFEAGANGAQPGIAVPARPTAGLRYRQEYAKGEAEDDGEVLSTAEIVSVPTGRYRDALLTRDTSAIEPDLAELKLYAKGIGPVLALDVSGGTARQELVKVDTVSSTAGTGPLGAPNP